MTIYRSLESENTIETMTEWKQAFFRGSKAKHWYPNRSAMSFAEYMLRYRDEPSPPQYAQLLRQLGIKAHGLLVRPEHNARFDKYNGPSNLDAFCLASVSAGETVAVGIEAKVDESFGSKTVAQYYRAAREKQAKAATNVPERIAGLVRAFRGSGAKPADARFGYQLLTLIAGTLAEAKRQKCGKALVVVHIFRTPSLDEKLDRRNTADLDNFIQWMPCEETSMPADSFVAGFRFGGSDVIPSSTQVELSIAKLETEWSSSA